MHLGTAQGDRCSSFPPGYGKPTRSKKLRLSPMPTDGRRSFLHFRGQDQIAKTAIWISTDRGNRRESKGNRLFPWRTTLLARSSELYLLRPQAREGMTPCFRRHRFPCRGRRTGSACAQAETGGCPQEDGTKSSSGDKREDFVPAGSQKGYKIPRPRPWRANTFFKNPPFVVNPIPMFLKSRWYYNGPFFIPLASLRTDVCLLTGKLVSKSPVLRYYLSDRGFRSDCVLYQS